MTMSSGQEGGEGGGRREKSLEMEFTKEEREEAGKLLKRVVSCNKCVKRIRRRMLAVKQRAVKVRVMSILSLNPQIIYCRKRSKRRRPFREREMRPSGRPVEEK